MIPATYTQRPLAVTAVCNTTNTDQIINGIACVPGDFVVTDANGISYTLDPDTFSKRYAPTRQPGDFFLTMNAAKDMEERLGGRLTVLEALAKALTHHALDPSATSLHEVTHGYTVPAVHAQATDPQAQG